MSMNLMRNCFSPISRMQTPLWPRHNPVNISTKASLFTDRCDKTSATRLWWKSTKVPESSFSSSQTPSSSFSDSISFDPNCFTSFTNSSNTMVLYSLPRYSCFVSSHLRMKVPMDLSLAPAKCRGV